MNNYFRVFSPLWSWSTLSVCTSSHSSAAQLHISNLVAQQVCFHPQERGDRSGLATLLCMSTMKFMLGCKSSRCRRQSHSATARSQDRLICAADQSFFVHGNIAPSPLPWRLWVAPLKVDTRWCTHLYANGPVAFRSARFHEEHFRCCLKQICTSRVVYYLDAARNEAWSLLPTCKMWLLASSFCWTCALWLPLRYNNGQIVWLSNYKC